MPYTAEGWELEILPHGWSECDDCGARDHYIHNNNNSAIGDSDTV